MRQQPRLRRLVVVGGYHQGPIEPILLGPFGQHDCVSRVVAAGAGDDVGTAAHGILDGTPEVALLPVGKGRSLAGRAGDHQAVGAVVDQPAGQLLGLPKVDIAFGIERSHHRGDEISESPAQIVLLIAGRGFKRFYQAPGQGSRVVTIGLS
jgi:hypothetical protein